MSWQDELRTLDDELAAGRISADDYRSRRDQILSTVVSPAAPPPEPATGEPATSEPATMIPTARVGGQQAEQGDADETQVVPGQEVGAAERTQAVGGWQATPPEDPNRTQVVPGVPPQAHGAYPPRPAPSPGGHFPPANQPPWQNEEELAPPWAGQEFPPLAAAGTADWTRQGPEVFEPEKKSGVGRALGIVAIVVVLVGIAAGAYFLFRPDDNRQADEPPQNDPQQQTSESPPPSPAPRGPIVELPGEASDMSRIDTFQKVERINYLTPQEIQHYRQGGAGDAAVAMSTEDAVQVIVLVVTMSDEAQAATTSDQLAQLQLRFSLTERDAPDGVAAAVNQAASQGPLLRAHYASGDQVVRVQTQGKDGTAAAALFDQVLADQLDRLPADG